MAAPYLPRSKYGAFPQQVRGVPAASTGRSRSKYGAFPQQVQDFPVASTGLSRYFFC